MDDKFDMTQPRTVDTKDIFALYSKSSLMTKLYLRIKLKICPLVQLEALFPKEGKIVDLLSDYCDKEPGPVAGDKATWTRESCQVGQSVPDLHAAALENLDAPDARTDSTLPDMTVR